MIRLESGVNHFNAYQHCCCQLVVCLRQSAYFPRVIFKPVILQSIDMTNSVDRDRLEDDISDNEDSDVEELAEKLKEVEIDVSKLTPLSPEIISKQVSHWHNSRDPSY